MSYTTRNTLAATIIAVIAAPALSNQQSNEESDQQINEEIITTASRLSMPVTKALATVDVLTASDIENSQAIDLPSLLGRLPGIDMDHSGGRGSNASFRIRGTESDHVLVLIDGIRVASASNGGTAIQHIPLHQIERVEVVRGPRSSLYGADAIGGVIQIFTKKGKGSNSIFSPNIRVGYGSHNTKTTDFSVSGSEGSSYYSLTASHEESDGINRTVGRGGADLDDDAYRETAASISVGHTFANELNIEANYLRSSGDTEFDSRADDATDFTNEAGSVRIKAPINSALTAKLELGYARDKRVTEGSNESVFDTTRDSALVQLDYQIDENQVVSAGYDYYNDQVDSTAGFTEGERNNKAVFVQYLGTFGQTSFQASLREDDNEAFGSETTGSAAVGYELENGLLLSVSYGEAFKAPSFNDLYFPFTDFGFGFTYEGNPDLLPESSETWEISATQSGQAVDWSVAVYRTEIENLIAGTADFSSVENINESEILGAEATLAFNLDEWQVDLSLGYIDAVNAETDDRLIRRARTKATADISRAFGKFNFAVSMLAQGDRLDSAGELGGYGIVGVRGKYQFTEALSGGFNINNLFDKEYTLLSSSRTTYRTEGQTSSVFVNYQF